MSWKPLALTFGGIFALWAVAMYLAPQPVPRDTHARPAQPAPTPDDAGTKAKADAERIARFNPAEFRARLKTVETLIAGKQWDAAVEEISARKNEFLPIGFSDRRREPAMVKLWAELQELERAARQGQYAVQPERQYAVQPEAARRVDESTLTSIQLFSAFEQNEIRANQQYKGQRFDVRGEIDRIATDLLNRPFITLKTDAILSVQAMFPRSSEAALANLNPGSRVTVTCLCEGKLGNVILSDCSLK